MDLTANTYVVYDCLIQPELTSTKHSRHACLRPRPDERKQRKMCHFL